MPTILTDSPMFRALRAALACAAIGFAASASAQTPTAQPVELRMSAAERSATGVDTLSPAQLAALNAWLNRTLDAESAKATEAAEKSIGQRARGLLNAESRETIRSIIPGDFRGFTSGRQYTLANGQVWEQVDSSELAGVRLQNPQAVLTPSMMGKVWYLSVDGFNSRAKVRRIK